MRITHLESGVFPEVEGLNPHFGAGALKLRYRLDTSLDNAVLGQVCDLDLAAFIPFFPRLSAHACGSGHRHPSRQSYQHRAAQSILTGQNRVDLAHYLEHLVLDIQYDLCGADSISGVTLSAGGDAREFTTVVESEDLASCVFAVNFGLSMMHQVLYTGAIDPRYGHVLKLAKWIRDAGRTHVAVADAMRGLQAGAPLARYCLSALRVFGFPVHMLPADSETTPSQLGPILVVEDDDDGRALLGETLSELGYHVRCARDGRSGVEILRRYDTSVAVLDVYLPDVDGVSIARWLLESQPATKLVLISGGVDLSQGDGLQNTDIRFLPKPFRISALHTTLLATSLN